MSTTPLAPVRSRFLLLALTLGTGGCLSPEASFVGRRIPTLCEQPYWICNVTAGCELTEDTYLESAFPGTRRVVVTSRVPETTLRLRMFLTDMEASGTELLVQVYEPACTMDTTASRVWMEDVDLFAEAGEDRTVDFDLVLGTPGEHLLEVYSDATTSLLMTIGLDR